ncbi:MAG: hypothetical protein PHV68_03535 [Candidatus Gastranaerophilales bacterium]|nr:hypothetical protein [Candidatus Gastranaerophilales bacterium]
MINQYLMVAENITFKNGKLSCINIFDSFTAISLPAEFNFDIVAICGPGWEKGDYDLKIMAKTDNSNPGIIGQVRAEIMNDSFVYNAIAPNIRFEVGNNVKNIDILVYRDDIIAISRSYKVTSLLLQNVQSTNKLQR